MPPMGDPRPAAPAYLALLVCVMAWGLVFVAVAELLPHVDAVQIVAVRFAFVGVACAVLLAVFPSQRPRFTKAEWRQVAICGVLAVPGAQYVIVEAQNHLSPPLTSLIITFSPAVAAVLAAMFLSVRLGWAEIGGFAMALVGVVVVLVAGAGTGAAVADSSPAAAAIALICPVAWAGYTMLVSRLVARHPPVGVMCVVFVIGAIVIAPTYPHGGRALAALDGSDWAWLGVLTVGASLAPNLLWVASLRRLPVHRAGAAMYLVPLFAAFWTGVLLGRPPEGTFIVGAVLILAGVALTQGVSGRRRDPATTEGATQALEATATPSARLRRRTG
jgi:drug/metabolite transporter (DMT)-like permease